MSKKALLIGINYIGSECELRGCGNDVCNVYDMLIEKLKFKPEEITILCDAAIDIPIDNFPTKSNIIEAMKNLVEGNDEGDEMYIHYSGHGSWEYELFKNRDEADGRDESIVPCDYEKEGCIIDDELTKILVQPLVKGSKLTAVFDCCHSGTALDLRYNYRCKVKKDNITYKIRQDNYKASKGNVVCISGCKDKQTSADAYIDSKYQGALTWSFLKTLKKHKYNLRYKTLMKEMLILLEKSDYSQIPQLSSGKYINIDSKFMKE